MIFTVVFVTLRPRRLISGAQHKMKSVHTAMLLRNAELSQRTSSERMRIVEIKCTTTAKIIGPNTLFQDMQLATYIR